MIRESLCLLILLILLFCVSLSAVCIWLPFSVYLFFLLVSLFWSWSENCQLNPDFIAFRHLIHMPSYSAIFLFIVVFLSCCLYGLLLFLYSSYLIHFATHDHNCHLNPAFLTLLRFIQLHTCFYSDFN